jgi:UDP-N-acetylmuramyl tripeptide synthase
MSLFAAKVAVARATGALSRRAGRGGGTTLPGKVLVRLEPDALDRLARRLPDGVVVLSATNGKTTTAAMAATILEPDHVLARNASGANLVSGIASAMVDAPPDARMGLFEVDEAALPEVASRMRPRTLLLANLFRDQLDRYGELELIASRWRTLLTATDRAVRLIVNADDVLVASLADDRAAIRFGIDDPRHALPELQHAADSITCPCGTPLVFRAVYLGHLGDYECPACGRSRGRLDVAGREIELLGLSGSQFRLDTPDGSAVVRLSLPGIYNVYNAVAAAALAWSLNVPAGVTADRLATFRAAFGRFEHLIAGGTDLVLLLIKNPAGANEALRALDSAIDGATLLVALNDGIADGRDVSWIWDVDFELSLPRAGHVICSGRRAADMALRALYAGVDRDRIEVQDDLEHALDRAIALGGEAAYLLPTYTAMLELQRIATARAMTRPYWEART